MELNQLGQRPGNVDVQVTLVLGNGVTGRITLPVGGGAGPSCTI